MVVSPYPSVLPSSPTLPAPARPTSLDHESTMEITSAIPDTHLDETEAPGAVITAEKEKQADGLTEGSPPPTSTSVQFIGINYVPDSTDVTTTSRPPPQQHPVPWESGATSPTSEGHVVIGLSTFPPKPCVVFTLFCLPPKNGKEKPTHRHVLYFVSRFFGWAHMSSCCRQVKRKVVPASSYHLGPPPEDSAYFTPPVGQIGVHHPREIVRVERDYTGGEVVQFSSAYPMELEGRVSGFRHAFTLRLFLFKLACTRSRRGSSWRASTP